MKSIIMSADSVNAILRGDKTMTRRPFAMWGLAVGASIKVGDVVYVKETWSGADDPAHKHCVLYRADGERYCRWRSSLFMPEWAARIHLRITARKVERLQEISFDGAVAEGIARLPGAVESFRVIWDRINAKRGYSWASNPWVAAYTFERVKP